MARACNPSYSGGWGRKIAWTQEAEVAVSRDRAIALQPGDRARLSRKTKNIYFFYFELTHNCTCYGIESDILIYVYDVEWSNEDN